MRKKIAALLVLGVLALGGLGYAASEMSASGTGCCGQCAMKKSSRWQSSQLPEH